MTGPGNGPPVWRLGHLRAVALAAVVIAGASTGVAGCGLPGVTQGAVQSAVASTFARLWILQQTDEGHPRPTIASLESKASCNRGSPSIPPRGAGNDWVCDVVWLVDGPRAPVTAIYDLNVKTDGCFTADGNGPAAVNGSPTIITGSGGRAINPLWAFDGCFDTQ